MEQRDVVDHALSRRACLVDLAAGRTTRSEVCDASPFLVRAAREWGLVLEGRCPVCGWRQLREISWVYGEALGDADGTARSRSGLVRLSRTAPDFAVYVVEVCLACSWNHLVRTFRTGTPGLPPLKRARRAADDPAAV